MNPWEQWRALRPILAAGADGAAVPTMRRLAVAGVAVFALGVALGWWGRRR